MFFGKIKVVILEKYLLFKRNKVKIKKNERRQSDES